MAATNNNNSETNDVERNNLQKVIHTFVYAGEEPSQETAARSSLVLSFLADYYKTARNSPSLCNITEAHAPSCNITTNSTNSSEKNVCTCKSTQPCTSTTQDTPIVCSTEYPSIYNGENNADEAERTNVIRDMTSKLTEKISKVCKGVSIGSNPTTSSVRLADTASTVSNNLEMGEVSKQLELFVGNINESLQQLGAASLTEEELKLLLATAPLPGMTNCNNDASDNSESTCVRRQRSHSTNDGFNRRKLAESADSNRKQLQHTVSDGAGLRQQLGGSAPGTYTLPTSPVVAGSALNLSAGFTFGRDRSGSLSEESSRQYNDDDKDKWPSKKRLSSFLSKKMESFTNILDKIEFVENEESYKTPGKGKITSPFGTIGRSGNSTPRSGNSTPRTGETLKSEQSSDELTPRSGYSTPRNLAESGEMGVPPLQLKIELVERALCDEVVVRTEAEQKAAELEELVHRLKAELDKAKSQNETVSVINKQMGVELRFLRQRNSKVVAERQQWEDALVGETQKRRELEKQAQMLISTLKEQNVAETAQLSSSGSLRDQEAIFARQREEVLLGVTESLRCQLDAAEAEAELSKLEWFEERARYQETHDLLRFQIDQLTLTRGGGGGGLGSSQQLQKDDSGIDGKIAEVMQKYDDRASARRLSHTVSVHDFHDKQNTTEVDAESKTKESAPTTPTATATTTTTTTRTSPSLPSIFKKIKSPERMKVFFLSSFWWPKLDFLKVGESANNTQLRPPVLLLQIAWWVAELREYLVTNHANLRLLPHSNQFCSCDDCVQHINNVI